MVVDANRNIIVVSLSLSSSSLFIRDSGIVSLVFSQNMSGVAH